MTEIEQKPAVYFNKEDGIWCYRASAMGMCEAALAMAHLEYDNSVALSSVNFLAQREPDGAG